MTKSARAGVGAVAAAAALFCLAPWGVAAQRPASSPQDQPEARSAAALPVPDDADAKEVREQLYKLLERQPPTVARVLKLDPSLMSNASFLAPYPALAAYLAQHPDIIRNPAYYFDRVSASGPYAYTPDAQLSRQAETYGMLGNILGGLAALTVFLVVTSFIVWLIRTIIDYRRWNRVSKAQFDLHGKLLDRFGTNEELMTYIQTPAGARFLEAAPSLPNDERPLGAPLSRIIWAVQAGCVLGVAGIGLSFLSWRLTEEASQFFFVAGIVTLALGVGFILSGAAAYALSRRLGLLDRPASDHA